MNKTKLTILLTVFIDVLGIGIVIPILPFYVESMGGGPMIVTALIAVYSLFSFFSSPLLGALSDRIGRRPILLVSILSSAIGWLVFASAKNLVLLFVGRIIDGLAAGNIQTTQSYLIDIAKDEKERASNLGLIGMVFGIGFIIGPLLGGLLAQISHSFPFLFVGCLSLVNVFSAYKFLPESNKNLKNETNLNLNPLSPVLRALRNKNLRPSYTVWFVFMIAVSLVQSIFSLFLHGRYGFRELAAGLYMTLIGVIVAFNQGFAMKKIWLKYFKEHHLGIWVLLTSAVGYILYTFGNVYILIFGLIITAFSQSLLRVVLTSQTVGLAGLQERGEVLGVLSSFASLGLMLGPLVGGFVYGININYPIYLASIFFVVAFCLAYNNRKKIEASEMPETGDINTI